MPEFAGLGTSLLLIVAVVLWIAYLVPVWTRKREYLATERNAIRLQQTLRIMAESAEAPAEVQIEADSRTVAVQQKAVAKEARLKQAMEHAKAVARARELDEQIKAVEREVRAAVKSSVSRAQRLRRTRLACFALVLLGVAAVVAGALVPGLQVLLALGAAVAALSVAGLVAVNASATRMRRVAEATAPRVHDLVEAREVAAEAVATEARMAEQVVARSAQRTGEVVGAGRELRAGAPQRAEHGVTQRSAHDAGQRNAHGAGRGAGQRTDEVLASRAWTPRPLPEQRLPAQYEPARHPSDDLLARARRQLAEDRRAISGPLARVTQLEPSFEDIIGGDERAELTDQERRLAQTQPALPIRELQRSRGVAAAEALDVQRVAAPIETAPDEHRVAPRAAEPAAAGSRFASMGVVADDLSGVDVVAAFRRRVG
ncbi:hypothetical protein [Agrococcus sp. Marseille-P2731]|uniref:hypothetical protein n=1 Tax=Agrococcus sp. Marseille-P2731 TaxID=1841862 RepID=UPI0009304106|nr:hypothetical protein [Agrococcus sp. Marseille-P2731]